MSWIKERLRNIYMQRLAVGIIAGTIGGYLYYIYIGCASGACAISSDPVNMTLYGSLIGATFAYKERRKNKKE